MARRQHLTLTLIVGVVLFFLFTWFVSSDKSTSADPYSSSTFHFDTSDTLKKQASTPMAPVDFGGLDSILTGGSIAPKLGNETAKYVFPERLLATRPQLYIVCVEFWDSKLTLHRNLL